jgi:hypothetical protein
MTSPKKLGLLFRRFIQEQTQQFVTPAALQAQIFLQTLHIRLRVFPSHLHVLPHSNWQLHLKK